MILDEMARWRPRPGPVLQVRPTPAAVRAAAAAPVHPGPPSFLQEDHLRGYAALRARDGVHRAWTGVATTLPGPLDTPALLAAIRNFLARHEGLRTWFDLTGEAPVRHLVPADAVELEAGDLGSVDPESVDVVAMAAEPLGLPQSMGTGPAEEEWQARLQALLADLFTAQCTPDAWPGFAVVVVDGGEEVGLAWACDHAFTDAVSQVLVAGELADLYAGARRGALSPAGHPEPSLEMAPSALDHAAAERRLAASYAGAPEVEEWAGLLERHGGLPRFALDLGLGPGETAPVRIRTTELLAGADLARFDAACQEAGARATGAIFGALAETERQLTGAEDYWAVTVLSTRGREYAAAQGWFCTFAPVSFRLPGAATDRRDPGGPGLGTLAAAGQQAFERAKRIGRMPVHVALGELLAAGRLRPEALGSPQLVSYLDLRWFPGADGPPDSAFARGLHFTGEGRTANASMWVNRDAERLYVVAQTPDTAAAQAAVCTYHERLRGVLAALARPQEAIGAGHVG